MMCQQHFISFRYGVYILKLQKNEETLFIDEEILSYAILNNYCFIILTVSSLPECPPSNSVASTLVKPSNF